MARYTHLSGHRRHSTSSLSQTAPLAAPPFARGTNRPRSTSNSISLNSGGSFSNLTLSSSSPSSRNSLSSRARSVLGNAYSQDVRRRINSAYFRFLGWADDSPKWRSHPLSPPPEDCLVEYISHSMAEVYAPATARRAIGYLRIYYEEQGYSWLGGGAVQRALKGVARMVHPSSVKAKREPVTLEMLDALASNLHLGEDSDIGRFDSAVMAAASTAFYGQLRLGEILPSSSSTSNYNHRRLPVAGDLSLTEDQLSYSLHLPSTKTSIHQGVDVLIPSQAGDPTDPVTAIYSHLSANDPGDEAPLFSY
ncbi:hypothetical protein V5O48_018014, partial [Marasmius crinis-equi]